MAKFTQQLAIAGWFALGITGLGVLLIWRTLVHTGRAANYAEKMVTEAKNTTAAAIRTADEARNATKAGERAADAATQQANLAKESLERLERPYLFIKFTDFNYLRSSGPNKPFINYTLVNHGRTPAILHSIAAELTDACVCLVRRPQR